MGSHPTAQGVIVRLLLHVLLLCCALVPTCVWASLQSSLDSMFMSNATPPQAYNSQSRGGFVGGGLSVRAPISNINMVAFDPVRLAAGCGGIDLYAGSFTFINAAQLAALMRQIAANASGALFKMAIDAISPEIGKIMEDFQNKLQALNSLAKNTCAIGTSIANDIRDPIARAMKVQAEAGAANTDTGKKSDWFDSVNGFFTSPQTNVDAAASDGTCPSCGNLVWKALAESNAGAILGSPGTSFTQVPTAPGAVVPPDVASSNEIVMSLLGTIITIQKPSAAAQAAGVPAAPTQVNGKEIVQNGPDKPHTINLWDLRSKSTGEQIIKIYRCVDDYRENGCLNPQVVPDVLFEGMEGYVNRILFGVVDGTSIVGGSLIDNLNNCSMAGCSFSAEQKRFIASISAPVLKMLRDVQRDPAAMGAIAQMLAPVIALELLEKYGIAAENAARNAFGGVKNTPQPPNLDGRLHELNAELISIRAERLKMQDKIIAAKRHVDLILANDPGLFVRTSTGR